MRWFCPFFHVLGPAGSSIARSDLSSYSFSISSGKVYQHADRRDMT